MIINSAIKTAKLAKPATVSRLFSFQLKIKATTNPAIAEKMLPVEKKIAGIKLAVPRQFKTGKAFQLDIVIHGADNKNIRAYLPVEVIISSAGKKLPGSGYYAAVDGKLTIKEIIPTNLPPGKVNITVRCLASGKTVQKQITLVK